jgi:hypothetical protein
MSASGDGDVVDGDVDGREPFADVGIADADLLLRDVDSLLIRRRRGIQRRSRVRSAPASTYDAESFDAAGHRVREHRGSRLVRRTA